MISKTIGFRGTLFSDTPKWTQIDSMTFNDHVENVESCHVVSLQVAECSLDLLGVVAPSHLSPRAAAQPPTGCYRYRPQTPRGGQWTTWRCLALLGAAWHCSGQGWSGLDLPNRFAICNEAKTESIQQFKLPVMFLTFLPCGKRLHNYGKSPFLMGKTTINGHFQ